MNKQPSTPIQLTYKELVLIQKLLQFNLNTPKQLEDSLADKVFKARKLLDEQA